MKIKLLFLLLAIFIFMAETTSAQNMLPHWGADNLGLNQTGVANTEMWRWGWSTTNSGFTWGTANGTSIRYRDAQTYAGVTKNGTNYIGRLAMARFDATNGSTTHTTLGYGDGTATTRGNLTPLHLTGCKGYNLSFLALGNNSSPCAYSAKVTTDSTGVDAAQTIATISISGLSSTALKSFNQDFTCPADGNYYIVFNYVSGDALNNGILYLGEIDLHQLTATPAIAVSNTYLYFDNTDGNTTKTFTVSGTSLTNNVTISSSCPAVTFNTATLTPVACGGTIASTTITASYNSSVSAINGTITVSDGTITKTITVDAIKNNLIGNWDGNTATGTGTEPTVFGWGYTGTTNTWGIVNQSTSTRIDATVSGTFNGGPWSGRMFLSRWDGITGSDLTQNFYLPVNLSAGKQYVFGGKSCIGQSASGTGNIFTINSANNNKGTSYGSVTVSNTSTVYQLTAGTFNFTVPTDGTYYLTIAPSGSSMINLPSADLFIYDNTSIPTATSDLSTTKLRAMSFNGGLRVLNVNNFNVFTVTGVKVASVNQNTSSTVVKLKHGVYVIKSGNDVQKVVVE